MNKYRMNKELSSFAARLRFAPAWQARDDEFDALALELFALQFQHNPAYRKICESRKLTPEAVEHWTQIPAVPTGAFKELELSCIPPGERTAVFHSSGTTAQKPSRHFHCAESLAVYEASLWSWFESEALGAGHEAIEVDAPSSHPSPPLGEKAAEGRLRGSAVAFNLILLTPPPVQAPHSSLVHMFETVRRNLGAPESVFVGKLDDDRSWTLDFDAALAALSAYASHLVPSALLLLGTAFSFVHLLDFLVEQDLRFNLPVGSRVMETGGYKNRSREMPKAGLHALVTERLGVPPENIICEYGMSELSSQAYSEARGAFHFPPWTRAQIISTETGRGVAEGETGLICVFDLANVFSVASVQTEDLGVRRGDGFELVGRAQLAEPRGCSLMTT